MKKQHIIHIAYDGCQTLDVTGPVSVFSAANKTLENPVYDITIASVEGGLIETEAGIALDSKKLSRIEAGPNDTVIVAGGAAKPLVLAMQDKALRDWLVKTAERVQRLSSVCSGSFILAKAGLLNGRRAATHWLGCDRLARDFPDLEVDPDALFVRDGKVWTSAGVTTGIDMTLAMVEEDLSVDIANLVARQLVLYARRPGNQSQFSSLLQAQSEAGKSFQPLIDWMKNNLSKPLDVSYLAEKACMSERSFHRHFTAQMNMTPAQFVLSLRLDAARALMVEGVSFKQIAGLTGFGSVARMSAAFEKKFGMRAALYRSLHGGSEPIKDG